MSDFDLSTIESLTADQEAGTDVTIVLPNGKPTTIVIKVAGPDSERVKKARWEVGEARVKDQIRVITQERSDAEDILVVAKSTISWSGVVIAGETIPLTIENAQMVYGKWPFIREQAERPTVNRANFIKT
jgi:hypothetical protein